MSALLAVAALSARMLAEAARDDGFRPIALDLFGDGDTRRAAEAWLPIGAAGRLAIDGPALLSALRRLSRDGAIGWIAGSGFEAQPELLAAAAQVLPLLGNAPPVVARVRDPAGFFGRLEALGIEHPETRHAGPPSPLGWLRKNAASSGGWEVWPAEAAGAAGTPFEAAAPGASGMPLDAAPGADASPIYYQRIAPGKPMSALFLADGRRGRLLGVNRQLARRFGRRPYVFRGCIGPLAAPPALRRRLEAMLDALSADFGLRGLNGLDFLLDGERLAVLELNPRPPASIALYRGALPGGLLRAHLAASLDGLLPTAREVDDRVAGRAPDGFEVLYARRAGRPSAAAADALGQLAWCHDRPAPGARIGRGEPLCTVSAAGSSAAEVLAQLRRRRRQISSLLEQFDAGSSEEVDVRALECQ